MVRISSATEIVVSTAVRNVDAFLSRISQREIFPNLHTFKLGWDGASPKPILEMVQSRYGDVEDPCLEKLVVSGSGAQPEYIKDVVKILGEERVEWIREGHIGWS